MNDKNAEKQVMEILKGLSANAARIKAGVAEGNLGESVRLTGERVALIEALRELRDAKVSLASSDIKDEMNLVVKNIENDTLEAIGGINAKLSSLLKELAKVKGARDIAAYKIQGGRYGY
ncbi:MAG: hypothetical protein M1469_09495 [Bacteroidetes bacterium]|nr:hypothetical protein [Bacteroidota bacterium]MCL5268321.1 hypothetical protein [Bacteroidota bacterium]